MPDDERVAASVLNNRTTQGRAEQNSAPFWSLVSTHRRGIRAKAFLVSWFQVAFKWAMLQDQDQDGLPRVGRRGSNGSGWNAAWQDVPFGHRRSRFWRARGAAAPLLEVLGQPKHGEVWVVNAWGVAMGFFHSVLLHLSVSQTRRRTTSPPIVLVPIGEASHKYAERWVFGAEGDTIREPPMQDGKQSRQCRMTVTVGEKGWWTRRRGGGVVPCLRLEVSPQQIVVQLRCRCPPRRLSGSRRARAHGPRLQKPRLSRRAQRRHWQGREQGRRAAHSPSSVGGFC